jgi:predicted MPP superfamily phosphohydrolase
VLFLRSRGRGRFYSPLRGLLETTLDVLYAGGWPARAWASVPGACDVRRVDKVVPLLGVGARTLEVGFVTDLHLGPTTPSRLLDRAFDAIAAMDVDVLLLGGDYVFLEATDAKARELEARLRAVPAARKIAVLGNHDLWARHDRIERALERAGVELLVNASTRLADGVALVALDDPWTGAPDARRAFADIGSATSIVVLCHAADALPLVRAELARLPGRRVLYLAGHTHGGHLAMPWGPLYVPGPVGKQHPAGLYTLEDLVLYVSRGVGATEVPARTWAPPEVARLELVASK